MNIQYLKTDSVKPYPNNPKIHSQDQIDELCYLITQFGFDQPIVVDKDKVIIKGHGRWKAAQALGMSDIPVVVAEHLKPEAVKLSRLADNDVVGLDWDAAMLKDELEDLLSKGGELRMASVSEDEFTTLLEASKKSSTSITDFEIKGLKTKFDCPKCGYRW